MPIFKVGPYINYCKGFYDKNKLNCLKKSLGKTLLVFPMHSTDRCFISINYHSYLKLLKEKTKKFNSVLINVYWWNINDPLIKRLESEGYKIVSAGFRDDIMFMNRLKTIINLSDLAIGDSVGTHIGYCLYCNVPFCYEDLGSKITNLSRKEETDFNFVRAETQKIKKAFLHSEEISNEHQEIVRYYWGTDHIRTREELRAMAEICKDITEMSCGWKFLFYKNACKLLKKYEKTDELKYRLLKEALR